MKPMLKLICKIQDELDEVKSYFIGRTATDTLDAKEDVAFILNEKTGRYDINIRESVFQNESAYEVTRKEETLPKLKEGSISKRKDGRWHGKYYDNGQRKNVYAPTKKDLIIKLNKAIIERDRADKQRLATKAIKLIDWVDKFIAIKAPKLKASTLDDYNNNLVHKVANHAIGKKRLSYITALDIERFLQSITAPSAQARTFRQLKSCFTYALKHKIILDSPFDLVEYIPEPKNKKQIPTEKQITTFFDKLKENNFELYLLCKFISLTGLRRGEALALEWADITDRISITKAYNKSANKVQTPKTKASVRYVPLFPEVVELLKLIPRNGKRVFSYQKPNAITRRMNRFNKNYNFSITLHSLRHYFATQCLEAGIERKVVQMWLGHAKYEVTINTYSHINNDFENKEIEKMSKYRGKLKK